MMNEHVKHETSAQAEMSARVSAKQHNRPNYQRELEKILKANEGRRPRLLLHACCAPCSSYVLEYLSQYFEITMFFYNPNIYTEEEYLKRANELKRLIAEMGLGEQISVLVPKYDHKEFLEIAKGLEKEPERGARCLKCYALRLEKTAQTAAEAEKQSSKTGYDYICTTLTISPLKDSQVLNEIGEQVAAQYNQRYLPSDFKKKGGYQRSIELSAEHQLYRQNYCGCEYSKQQSHAAGLEQKR